MRSLLVCVKTSPAAEAIARAASRLGLGHAVRTAVSGAEALARLAEAAPDVVLADTALTRPDTAGFTRRVRQRAPDAVILFFGPEDRTMAQAAVAAGARGLITGDEQEDLVSPVAKALMLLVMQGRVSLPQPVGMDRIDDLQAIWRLIEASSLGSDGVRRLSALVEPDRAASVVGQMEPSHSDQESSEVLFLLRSFVRECYGPSSTVSDPEGKIRSLHRLLLNAERYQEAEVLWSLADAARISQSPHESSGQLSEYVPAGEGIVGHGGRPFDALSESRASATLTATDPAAVHARVQRIVEAGEGGGGQGGRRQILTERELAVLRGMALGKSNAEIGRELFVSEDTVKTLARRLFRKLGARDRAHAVAAAFRSGLLS